ncbi:MAG: hypothetical protein GTO02_05300 [Candidatus Dadabacteria bacterium]|nr:hypothetical protein [Candidatus Dadabacteria bacterium]NIQ13827.1 hypothetical protein [Candidatus Dadabacteria bacterium]
MIKGFIIKSKFILNLSILFLFILLVSCFNNNDDTELNSTDIESFRKDLERMQSEDSSDNSSWEKLDEKLKQKVESDFKNSKSKREFFEKNYDLVGVAALIDFIEAKFPYCHSQAHDLGKTVFSKLLDFDKALLACGDGCTNGCMHGVIAEAFGDERYKDILKSVNGLCGEISTNFSVNKFEDVSKGMSEFCDTGEMSNLHRKGNCAHAMGHAIMVLSENDLDKSMQTCRSFEDKGMGYYCATGAFMEYVDVLINSRKLKKLEEGQTEFYPCDVYDDYPAACYRYMLKIVGFRKGIEPIDMISECKKLDERSRRGCYHGLGANLSRKIAKDPYLINLVCLDGSKEDTIMCIEGAIEKLADYNEEHALKVCATLLGENRKLCEAAAYEKIYRPNKPSLDLYCN